ncbi:MAG TPA: hypothetical protein VGP70_28475, partial [Actinomadura sp.]|nr:hypothetical protein [Actinomadura sp.]
LTRAAETDDHIPGHRPQWRQSSASSAGVQACSRKPGTVPRKHDAVVDRQETGDPDHGKMSARVVDKIFPSVG